MRLGRGWLLALVAVTGAVTACGDDDSVSPPTTAVAVDVVASLLTPADLGEDWSVTVFPEGDTAIDGAVTDVQQPLLPRPELCESASAVARNDLETMRWQAFRSLELAVDDGLDPPTDRTGHVVFLQQLLATAPVEVQRATFDRVRQGFVDCLGEIPAGEEGPGRADLMPVPAVGDDRFGVLVTVAEAGDWAQWRLHQVMVLDGTVLMAFMLGDIRSNDVTPYFTTDDVGDLLITAVDVLRSRRSP